MSDETFDRLFQRFGVEDVTVWYRSLGWFRVRGYSDGAWLEGNAVEPIAFWGS